MTLSEYHKALTQIDDCAIMLRIIVGSTTLPIGN